MQDEVVLNLFLPSAVVGDVNARINFAPQDPFIGLAPRAPVNDEIPQTMELGENFGPIAVAGSKAKFEFRETPMNK